MALSLTTEVAKDGAGTTITGGVRFNNETGSGPIDQVAVLIDSAQNEVLGTIADAAYTSGSAGVISILKGVFTRLAPLGDAASVSTTRPANTTAYTAGDVVGASTSVTSALSFTGLTAGEMMITSSQFMINDTAILSGETTYQLHLYSATPGSAYVDNAAWDLPSGDRSTYLGYITLGAPVLMGASTLYVENNILNKQITLTGTTLYAYLITNGGYTPESGRVFSNITLHFTIV